MVFVSAFGGPDTTACREDILYTLRELHAFAYTSDGGGVIGWTAMSSFSAVGNDVLSMAPGGPANALMWHNATYEQYLVPIAKPMPFFDEVARRLYVIENYYGDLTFLGGYVPFQKIGSHDLAKGGAQCLYSNQADGPGGLSVGSVRIQYKGEKENPQTHRSVVEIFTVGVHLGVAYREGAENPRPSEGYPYIEPCGNVRPVPCIAYFPFELLDSFSFKK